MMEPREGSAPQVIFDAFKDILAAGVPKDCASSFVDEQFGPAVLRATRKGSLPDRVIARPTARNVTGRW